MRLSCREDDPGFNAHLVCRVKILCDGADITARCYTADEELGQAFCFACDKEGKFFVDPITNDAAKETLFGNVEIIRMHNGVAP